MRLAKFDLGYLRSAPAVIGVDEAGRGPLAGPVCAAAVYANQEFYKSDWVVRYGPAINDSKQLTEEARERIFAALEHIPPDVIHWSCRLVDVEDIEALNILGATRKAMALCLEDLARSSTCPFRKAYVGEDPAADQRSLFCDAGDQSVAHVLVDGRPLKPFSTPHTAVVKGDGKSLAIALASIIAKVTRDRYMREQAVLYPEYGFVSNKGYGTMRHIEALRERGPCKLHRRSFLSRILNAQ